MAIVEVPAPFHFFWHHALRDYGIDFLQCYYRPQHSEQQIGSIAEFRTPMPGPYRTLYCTRIQNLRAGGIAKSRFAEVVILTATIAVVDVIAKGSGEYRSDTFTPSVGAKARLDGAVKLLLSCGGVIDSD